MSAARRGTIPVLRPVPLGADGLALDPAPPRWIVGQASRSLSFAVVGNDPVVDAATPELALVIAALEDRKVQLLAEG